MQTIYQFDDRRIYTGVYREIGDDEGAPIGWTFNAPPALAEGQFASFSGPEWVILDEYPASVSIPVEVKPTLEELKAQLAVLTAQIAALSAG